MAECTQPVQCSWRGDAEPAATLWGPTHPPGTHISATASRSPLPLELLHRGSQWELVTRHSPSHLSVPLRRGSRPADPAALELGSAARKGEGAARPLALVLDAATEQHHSNYSNGVSAEQWEKYRLQKVYNCVICCWQNSLQKNLQTTQHEALLKSNLYSSDLL